MCVFAFYLITKVGKCLFKNFLYHSPSETDILDSLFLIHKTRKSFFLNINIKLKFANYSCCICATFYISQNSHYIIFNIFTFSTYRTHKIPIGNHNLIL